MNVTAIAASGMSKAAERFERSAGEIARFGGENGRTVDLGKEVAEMVLAKVAVEANAAVARTGSRTVGSLMDILV